MSTRESHALMGTLEIHRSRTLSEQSIEKSYHCPNRINVGAGTFFPHSYRVPQALTRVLGAAGADSTTLGDEEMIVSACQQCDHTLVGAVRRHKEARRARIRVVTAAELVWQSVERSRKEDA